MPPTVHMHNLKLHNLVFLWWPVKWYFLSLAGEVAGQERVASLGSTTPFDF